MVGPGATGREEAKNLLFALLGVCALKNRTASVATWGLKTQLPGPL